MKAKPTLRELNSEEKEIIDTLLTRDFKGREEIKDQINTAKVRKCCDCGCNSIEFSITSNIIIPIAVRVPVEASYFKGKNPYHIFFYI